MARQLTEQQRLRARRDEKTLLDAGWALRRLADTRRYQGVPPYVAYALAGTLDAAAYAIETSPTPCEPPCCASPRPSPATPNRPPRPPSHDTRAHVKGAAR
jgi:hypothetical protein